MKKQTIMTCLLILAGFLLNGLAAAQARFSSQELKIELGKEGQLKSLVCQRGKEDFLFTGNPSFLLKIKTAAGWESPGALTMDEKASSIRLFYQENKVNITIIVTENPGYLSFEISEVMPEGLVDLVSWGPVPLTLNKTAAEIIGVVSNDSTAIGLMPLNVKTLGGFPLNDEGSDPSRSSSAQKTDYGSVIQAYSMDRSRERKVSGWWGQFPDMPVEPVKGETVKGSKVALFACKSNELLDRIGAIELAEGLPHPLYEGNWAKRSPRSGRSYLIADYSEETIDELLEYTSRANLQTLYHMNAWASWGHYELNPEFFPHGLRGLKTCMEKAKSKNILLGAHTLTDFINTNDAYVTPVPDKRLAITGGSTLTAP